ncbi:MAG TPA: DUF5011 domain-containing protein [Candidatus Hydrogenedentes bacterium]|nr:DUF5011 domain-containing protein [Candidatus Hydrogenedentota bacterium]
MDANKSVMATFIQGGVPLTVYVQGEGGTTPSSGTHYYIQDANIPLSAYSNNPHWGFDHWSGAIDTTAPSTSVLLNSPKSVTAIFKPIYTAFFSDSFDTDATSFSLSGLWHVTTQCNAVLPGHGSIKALYYGSDDICTYDKGTSEGSAVMPVVDLTTAVAPVYLFFAYYIETEQAFSGADIATVEISQNDGPYQVMASNNPSSGVVTLSDPTGEWRHAYIDLTDYIGSSIQVRFRFCTIDGWLNNYAGFYVDDIVVYDTPVGGEAPVKLQDLLEQLCQALGHPSGCAQTVDMNGPEGGPNGILDAAEIALIEALLQDPTLDFSAFGGIQANGPFIASWLGNLQTMQFLLAGSGIEALAPILAAFITLGDEDSVQFVADTVLQLASLTLNPDDFDLTQEHHLSYAGDADHDGILNIDEFRNHLCQSEYPDIVEEYVQAALDSSLDLVQALYNMLGEEFVNFNINGEVVSWTDNEGEGTSFDDIELDGNNMPDAMEFALLQNVLENHCLNTGPYGVANTTALAAWSHNLETIQNLIQTSGSDPIEEGLPEYDVSDTVLTSYITLGDEASFSAADVLAHYYHGLDHLDPDDFDLSLAPYIIPYTDADADDYLNMVEYTTIFDQSPRNEDRKELNDYFEQSALSSEQMKTIGRLMSRHILDTDDIPYDEIDLYTEFTAVGRNLQDDLNGFDHTGNGIPDIAELCLIQYALQHPTFNSTAHMNAAAMWFAVRGFLELKPGETTPDYLTFDVYMAYICLLDPWSVEFGFAHVPYSWPDDFGYHPQFYWGAYGDADADGFSNLLEWQATPEAANLQTKITNYNIAALDPNIYPDAANYKTMTRTAVGNGTILPYNGTQQYPAGTTVTVIAQPGEGWTFDHWEITGVSPNPVDLTQQVLMDTDKTVTAIFKCHTLTIIIMGEGTVEVRENGLLLIPINGAYGLLQSDNVEITAVPAEHWGFTEWQGAVSGAENPINTTINDNTSITAYFTQTEYPLTLNVSGTGSINPEAGTHYYAAGTNVTLTATQTEFAWPFVSWCGDLQSKDNPALVLIDGATSVTANFEDRSLFTLTVNIDKSSAEGEGEDGGEGENGEPSVTVENERTSDTNITTSATADYDALDGDLFHLTANPGKSDFLGWATISTEGNTTSIGARPEIAFIIEEDTEMTAYFAEREYYCPGEVLNLSVTFHYPQVATVTALGFELQLPDGWSYQSLSGIYPSGSSPALYPSGNETGTLDFVWINFGSSKPITFTIYLNTDEATEGEDESIRELRYLTLFRTNDGPLQTDVRVKQLVAGGTCSSGNASINIELLDEMPFVSQYQELLGIGGNTLNIQHLLSLLGESESEPCQDTPHSADIDQDWLIGLSELLRVIQLFNAGEFHCQSGNEDGYALGTGDQSCTPHNSDYNPQNWFIDLSELLRLIQFYNSGGYRMRHSDEEQTEDGFIPGWDGCANPCTPPTITLSGSNPYQVECHEGEYLEPGVTAQDACGNNLENILSDAATSVDISTPGQYTVHYSVTDSHNNYAHVERIVNIVDTTPPVITLIGNTNDSADCLSSYNDPGATVTDTCDTSISSANIQVNGTVDTTARGDYVLTYNITDASGNPATPVTRTVTVPSSQGDGPFTLVRNISPSDSGIIQANPDSTTYLGCTQVSLTAVANTGWIFDHWQDNTTQPSINLTMDGDKNVTAYFAALALVTVSIEGEGTYTLSPPGGAYISGTLVAITADADDHWRFDHWEGDVPEGLEQENPLGLTANGNMNLVAVFVPILYRVYATTSGPGSIYFDPPAEAYTYDAHVTLKALPAPGWSFNNWEGDTIGINASQSEVSFNVDGDRHLIANLTQDSFSLQVVSIGEYSFSGKVNASVSDSDPYEIPSGGKTYPAFTKVKLSPAPNEGAYFQQWENGSDENHTPIVSISNSPLEVIMDGPKTINAIFKRKFFLSVNPPDGWDLTLQPPQHPLSSGYNPIGYMPGTRVIAKLFPSQDKYLVEWHETDGGVPIVNDDDPLEAVFIMDQNRIVSIAYSPGYQLCVDTIKGSSGSEWPLQYRDYISVWPQPQGWHRSKDKDNHDLPAGRYSGHLKAVNPTPIHLKAVREPGYDQVFFAWETETGEIISRDAEIDLEMTGHLNLQAHYVNAGASITLNILGFGGVQIDGGEVVKLPQMTQTLEYNDEVTTKLHAIPNTGWIFDHWTVEPWCDLTETDLNNITGDLEVRNDQTIIVSAIFIPEADLVVFPADVNQDGKVNGDDVSSVRNNINTPVCDINGDETTDLFDCLKVIDAVQGRNNAYRVFFDVLGGGSICASTKTIVDPGKDCTNLITTPFVHYYAPDTSLHLLAQPDDGYVFKGWGGSFLSRNDRVNCNVGAQMSIKAIFFPQEEVKRRDKSAEKSELDEEIVSIAAKPFHVYLDNDGDGQILPVFESEPLSESELKSITPGTNIDLTARPDFGWSFIRWEGDISSTVNEQKDLKIRKNFAVRAVCKQNVEITPISVGNGETVVVDPDMPSDSAKNTFHTYGKEITVQAVPARGWYFSHWDGSLHGTNPSQTLKVEHNMATVAHYSLNQVTIQANYIEEGGHIRPSTEAKSVVELEENTCSVTTGIGKMVTFTAKPNETDHWAFIGWQDKEDHTGRQCSTGKTIKVIASEPRSFWANFAPTYPVTFLPPPDGQQLIFTPDPVYIDGNMRYYPAGQRVLVSVPQVPASTPYVAWDLYGTNSPDPAVPHAQRYENPLILIWPDEPGMTIGCRYLPADPEAPFPFIVLDSSLPYNNTGLTIAQEWAPAVDGNLDTPLAPPIAGIATNSYRPPYVLARRASETDTVYVSLQKNNLSVLAKQACHRIQPPQVNYEFLSNESEVILPINNLAVLPIDKSVYQLRSASESLAKDSKDTSFPDCDEQFTDGFNYVVQLTSQEHPKNPDGSPRIGGVYDHFGTIPLPIWYTWTYSDLGIMNGDERVSALYKFNNIRAAWVKMPPYLLGDGYRQGWDIAPAMTLCSWRLYPTDENGYLACNDDYQYCGVDSNDPILYLSIFEGLLPIDWIDYDSYSTFFDIIPFEVEDYTKLALNLMTVTGTSNFSATIIPGPIDFLAEPIPIKYSPPIDSTCDPNEKLDLKSSVSIRLPDGYEQEDVSADDFENDHWESVPFSDQTDIVVDTYDGFSAILRLSRQPGTYGAKFSLFALPKTENGMSQEASCYLELQGTPIGDITAWTETEVATLISNAGTMRVNVEDLLINAGRNIKFLRGYLENALRKWARVSFQDLATNPTYATLHFPNSCPAVVSEREMAAFLYGVFVGSLCADPELHMPSLDDLPHLLNHGDTENLAQIKQVGYNLSLIGGISMYKDSLLSAIAANADQDMERKNYWPYIYGNCGSLSLGPIKLYDDSLDSIELTKAQCEALVCGEGGCQDSNYIMLQISTPNNVGYSIEFTQECVENEVLEESTATRKMVKIGPLETGTALDITVRPNDDEHIVVEYGEAYNPSGEIFYAKSISAGSLVSLDIKPLLQLTLASDLPPDGNDLALITCTPDFNPPFEAIGPVNGGCYTFPASRLSVELATLENDEICFYEWYNDLGESNEGANLHPVQKITLNSNVNEGKATCIARFYTCDQWHTLTVNIDGSSSSSANMLKINGCYMQSGASASYRVPIADIEVFNIDDAYDFTGWTEGPCTNATNSPCSFTLSDDTTVTALFTPKNTYDITLNVQGGQNGLVLARSLNLFSQSMQAQNDGQTVSGAFIAGSYVELTAIPLDANSKFAGWEGVNTGDLLQQDCTNAPSLTASTVYICNLDSDITLTARFEEDTGEGGILPDIIANSGYYEMTTRGGQTVARYDSLRQTFGPRTDIPHAADPVLPFSGEFHYTYEDLRVPCVGIPFSFVRTYQSQSETIGAFGKGWDYSYNIYIELSKKQDLGVGSIEPATISLHSGTGRVDHFKIQREGWLHMGEPYWTHPQFPGKFIRLTKGECGIFTAGFRLLFEDGTMWDFYYNTHEGPTKCLYPESVWINTIQDRNAHKMVFDWDKDTSRIKIKMNAENSVDPRYAYLNYKNYNGHLQMDKIEFFYTDDKSAPAAFTVSYDYDDHGNLETVSYPDGTSLGYTYCYNQAQSELNGNMESIIDQKGQTYLILTYGTNPSHLQFDHVIEQIWGGGKYTFNYTSLYPTPENNYAVITTIVTDPRLSTRSLTYDALNRGLVEVVDDSLADDPADTVVPRETKREWDDNSRLKHITYPDGSSAAYTYEDGKNSNNPTEIVYASANGEARTDSYQYNEPHGFMTFSSIHGYIQTYEYDSQGNRTFTYRSGTVTPLESITYFTKADGKPDVWIGQIKSVTGPENGDKNAQKSASVKTYGYDDFGYIKFITDCDNQTEFTNDSRGNPIRIVNPAGGETLYTYDAMNRVMFIINPSITAADKTSRCYLTSYEYDPNGNLTRMIRGTTSIDCNSEITGAPDLSWFDENDREMTEFPDYDMLNHVKEKKVYFTGKNKDQVDITSYEYDPNGNLTTVRIGQANTVQEESGNIFTYTYTRMDRVKTISHGNLVTSFTYDAMGRVLTKTEHGGAYTYTYTGLGLLETMTEPSGTCTTYTYDTRQNIESIQVEGVLDDSSPANTVLLSKTYFVYFDNVNLVQTKCTALFNPALDFSLSDPSVGGDDWRREIYEYNYCNQVKSVKDGEGNRTDYHYYGSGNVSQIEHPDGTVENFDYTPLNKLKSHTTENNNKIVSSQYYEYDELGRPIKISVNESAPFATIAYDSRSNVVSRSDFDGNVKTALYDGANHVIQEAITPCGETTPAIVADRDWDRNGRLISETDNKGNVTTYIYNALDQLITILYPTIGLQEDFTYDEYGNMHTRMDANSSVITMTYDSQHRLIRKEYVPYDPIKCVPALYDEFHYDGLSRIVTAENNVSTVIRQYDSTSNLISENIIFEEPDPEALLSNPSSPPPPVPVPIEKKILETMHNEMKSSEAVYKLFVVDSPGGEVSVMNMGNWMRKAVDTDGVKVLSSSSSPQVALHAEPYDGYQFSQWLAYDIQVTGDSITATPLTLANSENIQTAMPGTIMEVMAVFVPKVLPSIATAYTYYNDGDLHTVEYPNADTWTYIPDKVHELYKVESGVASVTFDSVARGILGTKTFGNGNTSTFEFPATPVSPVSYRPSSWVNNIKVSGSVQELTETYAYDNNAQLTAIDGDAQGYVYTGTQQIIQSLRKCNDGNEMLDYRYDTAGNRTSVSATLCTSAAPEIHPAYSFEAYNAESMELWDSAWRVPSINYENSNAYASGPAVNPDVIRIHRYDYVGNLRDILTTNGTDNTWRHFAYDINGRLIRHSAGNTSTQMDNPATWYLYDALGRRIQKTAPERTIRYIYSGNRVIEERGIRYNTQTSAYEDYLVASYVYGRGLDEPVIMRRDVKNASGAFTPDGVMETYYFHLDPQGNIRCLTDDVGNVVEAYAYNKVSAPYVQLPDHDSPDYSFQNDFGLPIILDPDTDAPRGIKFTDSGLPTFVSDNTPLQSKYGNRFLFQGREWDPELGLYYYRARYMDPLDGRFTSPDPLGPWGDPANFGNPYTFAANNPWNLIDPYGLCGKPSWNLGPRFFGGLNMFGGIGEMAGGVFLLGGGGVGTVVTEGLGAPLTIPAIISGWLSLGLGADNFTAGFNQLYTGEYTQTATSQLIAGITGSYQAGEIGACVVNMAAPLGGLQVIRAAQTESLILGQIADDAQLLGQEVSLLTGPAEVATSTRGGIGPVNMGKEGVALSRAEAIERGLTIVGDESSFLLSNGRRLRVDLVGETKNGIKWVIESKNGPTAALTAAQRAGYWELATQGATPVGVNASRAGFQVGTQYKSINVWFDYWNP